MSKLSCFFKENVETIKPIKYIASKRIKDDKGNPVEWEIKPLTQKRIEVLTKECTKKVCVNRKTHEYKDEFDTFKFVAKMAAESTVYPDLLNPELQDNYGCVEAHELLRAILNVPGEYADYTEKIQEINGYTSLEEEVQEAKN